MRLDKDALADISFGECRIDVKTWNEKYWNDWGRCISVKQFPHIKAKATHIVWCTSNASEVHSTWSVLVRGWNLVDDIKGFPKKWTGPLGHQVYNFQGRDADIRLLDLLIPELFHQIIPQKQK